ncbi:fra a 1-associated protein [Lolium perenne]|uniref:fra a 1-associated protein n=1 Tax=Lolium perenne TaxID=4522 RepID=UPI0021EB0C5E|nr:fra a 1-associated protein [Lolium perenne]
MGWRWHDDGEGDGDGGRGLGGVPDLAGRGGGEGAHVGTRRVVQSRCHTEEVEPGRFVRKCEKTEQLLRDCVGRPSELVESKTEHTEEDVTDEMTGASHSLGFPTKEPFAFPGLRSDIEAIEKDFTGNLSSFMEEAERMTNDFFRSFGFPSTHDEESRALPRRPVERHVEEGTAKKAKENEYSEFGSQITDV